MWTIQIEGFVVAKFEYRVKFSIGLAHDINFFREVCICLSVYLSIHSFIYLIARRSGWLAAWLYVYLRSICFLYLIAITLPPSSSSS